MAGNRPPVDHESARPRGIVDGGILELSGRKERPRNGGRKPPMRNPVRPMSNVP
jgi:hypothetical protein